MNSRLYIIQNEKSRVFDMLAFFLHIEVSQENVTQRLYRLALKTTCNSFVLVYVYYR